MDELAATAFVAVLIVLLPVRTIGYREEQCSGGEIVSVNSSWFIRSFLESEIEAHGLNY